MGTVGEVSNTGAKIDRVVIKFVKNIFSLKGVIKFVKKKVTEKIAIAIVKTTVTRCLKRNLIMFKKRHQNQIQLLQVRLQLLQIRVP